MIKHVNGMAAYNTSVMSCGDLQLINKCIPYYNTMQYSDPAQRLHGPYSIITGAGRLLVVGSMFCCAFLAY